MSLSPVRLNNKNNLTVQYSDQVGRKSKISAALAKRPPLLKEVMGFGARDNLALLSELQTSGTVCTAAFDVKKTGSKPNQSGAFGETRRRDRMWEWLYWLEKICLMLFYWSLWNELHVFIMKTLHCNTSSVWGQTDSKYQISLKNVIVAATLVFVMNNSHITNMVH